MSDPFIVNARARLDAAVRKANVIVSHDPLIERQLADLVLSLAPIASAAIDAVEGDGTAPASLCNEVVRYGRLKETR